MSSCAGSASTPSEPKSRTGPDRTGPDRTGLDWTGLDQTFAPGCPPAGKGRGYTYFGAAKKLPGVKELFEAEPVKVARRSRHQMYRSIDPDYYGFRDEEDGVMVRVEADAEKIVRMQVGGWVGGWVDGWVWRRVGEHRWVGLRGRVSGFGRNIFN
jgi:hypothetical protein